MHSAAKHVSVAKLQNEVSKSLVMRATAWCLLVGYLMPEEQLGEEEEEDEDEEMDEEYTPEMAQELMRRGLILSKHKLPAQQLCSAT